MDLGLSRRSSPARARTGGRCHARVGNVPLSYPAELRGSPGRGFRASAGSTVGSTAGSRTLPKITEGMAPVVTIVVLVRTRFKAEQRVG